VALLGRSVKLWSTELERGPANLVTFRGHLFPVWDVAACPGGQYFASGSADRTARLWSTERAQSLRLFAGAAFVQGTPAVGVPTAGDILGV
jgi:transcription initiation factor TFIID subunit 5